MANQLFQNSDDVCAGGGGCWCVLHCIALQGQRSATIFRRDV
jgi:hypothetical protein